MAEQVFLEEHGVKPCAGAPGGGKQPGSDGGHLHPGEHPGSYSGGPDGARFLPGSYGKSGAGAAEEKEGVGAVRNRLWPLIRELPPLLRKQALLRFARAGACFVLLIVTALVYRDHALCLPFLLCGAVCAGLGVLLVRRIAQGRFVVLEGTVQKVEKTLFRSRPKAVIAACDGRLVKVYLRGRRWGLSGRGQVPPLCGGQHPSLRAGRRLGAGRVFGGGASWIGIKWEN